jgi:hypothetical protein
MPFEHVQGVEVPGWQLATSVALPPQAPNTTAIRLSTLTFFHMNAMMCVPGTARNLRACESPHRTCLVHRKGLELERGW